VKKLLAYIFLTIFSFQVLPVKEIGKILFKGQMTEEIHESGPSPDNGNAKLKKGTDPFRLHNFDTKDIARIQYLSAKICIAIVEAERLPKQFIPDIVTPPPNFA
jgi:hypothetical protein